MHDRSRRPSLDEPFGVLRAPGRGSALARGCRGARIRIEGARRPCATAPPVDRRGERGAGSVRLRPDRADRACAADRVAPPQGAHRCGVPHPLQAGHVGVLPPRAQRTRARRGVRAPRLAPALASGAVVKGDLVAVRVGEGEGTPEGAVDGSRDDRVTVGGERVVNLLGVRCVHPDRDSQTRLRR